MAATPARAVALAIGLAIASSALAQPPAQGSIETAERAFNDARFDAARVELRRVLARPDLDPATALRAHRHLAAVEAILGDEEAARDHARAAVALLPAVTAPSGASSANRWFDDARREAGGLAAEIEIEMHTAGDLRVVTAAVVPAPPRALVSRLRLVCARGGEDGAGLDAAADGSAEWRTPGPGAIRCEASAHTAQGAVMITAQRRFDAPRAGPVAVLPAHGEEGRDDEDPGGTPTWGWIAAGVGAAAIVTVVTVLLIGGSGEDGSTRIDGVDLDW